MENLHIPGTRSTPDVHFDSASGVLSMSGESYPENSYEFFQPILSWISRFAADSQQPVTLNISLTYLNTGSTKCMLDILDILEEQYVGGRQVAVNWFCDKENDRALETAEEFREEVTMPFEIRPASEQQ